MLGKYVLKILYVALYLGILSACGPGSPGRMPGSGESGANALQYGGSSRLLSNGILELYEAEGYHYNYDITLTDGSFFPISYFVGDFLYTYWAAGSDEAEIYAELFAAGATFQPGTFTYAPPTSGPGSPLRPGQNYFEEAYVGVDLNGDKEIGENEELQVTGGTLTVAGSPPNLSVSFDVQLTNGLRAQGAYSGEFFMPY